MGHVFIIKYLINKYNFESCQRLEKPFYRLFASLGKILLATVAFGLCGLATTTWQLWAWEATAGQEAKQSAVLATPEREVFANKRLARVRLIARTAPTDEAQGALEITMEQGVHTYWRTPGFVGVPPDVSFAGSDNLAEIRLEHPAPQKIVEAGSIAYGWQGRVLWPIFFRRINKNAPARLAMRAHVAFCGTICVPASFAFSLPLDGAADDTTVKLGQDASALLDAAQNAALFALAPANLGLEAPKPLAKEACGAQNPPFGAQHIMACWTFALSRAQSAVEDLFAEGPDQSWLFDVERAQRPEPDAAPDKETFVLFLVQRPQDKSPSSIPITLTASSQHPWETHSWITRFFLPIHI